MKHGLSFVRRRILVLLTAALVVASSRSAAGQEGEPEFVNGLASVQSAMRARNWPSALEALDKLLEAHAERSYVLARRAEIVELHQRSLFHSRTNAPEPDAVVSGKVLSCNFASGHVKIRYTTENLADFKTERELRIHPARFAGDYTVEVKGDCYPKLGGAGAPCIWVCLDGEDGYGVSFGCPKLDDGAREVIRWMPARIVSARARKAIAEREVSLARPGKPFRLNVKVTGTWISAFYDEKPLLRVRKPAGLFGHFGFSGLDYFRELVVQGKAEPAWLQGKIDAALADERRAFAGTYRPENYLPTWLFEPPRDGAAVAPASPARDYPGDEPTAGERIYLERAATLLERGELDKLERFLQGSGEGAIAAVRRAFLLACCFAKLEEWNEALEAARTVCQADPDFAPAQALVATATYHLGRHAEALETVAGLLARHPGSEDLHETRILLLLREGRVAEALEAAVEARRQVPASAEIEKLHAVVVKADKGPDWPQRHVHKSAHYLVCSDIDRAVCAEAAKVLEDAYRAYNAHIRRIQPDDRRFRVYLFSGQAGFLAHCRDALGSAPVNAAGVYSPVLKQLLIWNLPDRASMMRTVRHEGFHQYLDRILNDPPVWLNEGLAVYYETATHVVGRWKTGEVRHDLLKRLDGALRSHPIKEIVRLSPAAFYRRAPATYAEAWALVHFLLHPPKPYRSVFDELFAELSKEGATAAAVDRMLAKVDLDAMDAAFRLYLKDLARER
ncbi:MAG: DUF1570 domain-containing protein [Planctomycetes bacterium]|nr:DUF1570 domain-containing protein [Planctomycetota bacterium]